ncbi:U-scoloptoxin(01)-Er1a-like [Penaeus vannamei]|uniref:U-scoloptoxin(01)-Er1a-like n=1 Tax=Penaeus vannamei TaxID=6689 RepID=UPI00387F51FD
MDSCVQPLGLGSLPSSHMFLLQPRLLLLLLLFLLVGAQEPPPNYSHDLLPETNFTCSDKATGGYYADPEAGCQMFHVCVRVSDEETGLVSKTRREHVLSRSNSENSERRAT